MARALNDEKAGASDKALARLDKLAGAPAPAGRGCGWPRPSCSSGWVAGKRRWRWPRRWFAPSRATPRRSTSGGSWPPTTGTSWRAPGSASARRWPSSRARARCSTAWAGPTCSRVSCDKAALFLEQAARLEPEDPEVLGHLAELLRPQRPARPGRADPAQSAGGQAGGSAAPAAGGAAGPLEGQVTGGAWEPGPGGPNGLRTGPP